MEDITNTLLLLTHALLQFVGQAVHVAGDNFGITIQLFHTSLEVGQGGFDIKFLIEDGGRRLAGTGTD